MRLIHPISSAGSERLPYTQNVDGSNPPSGILLFASVLKNIVYYR